MLEIVTEPRTPKEPRKPQVRQIGTREAAGILGVDPDTVRANAARLHGQKVLGRWRYPEAAVRAAAAGQALPTDQEHS